jgi:hypothetical protein
MKCTSSCRIEIETSRFKEWITEGLSNEGFREASRIR